MIEFTPQQHLELIRSEGNAVRAADPATRQEYVIVPAAIYEQLTRTGGNAVHDENPATPQKYVVLSPEAYEGLRRRLDDDVEWSPEQQLQLLAESGKQAGWDDPMMDVYDNYDENHRKLCP